jgi:hypothetical protein
MMRSVSLVAGIVTVVGIAVVLWRCPRRPLPALLLLVPLVLIAAHMSSSARARSIGRLPRVGPGAITHLIPRLGNSKIDPPIRGMAGHANWALTLAARKRVPESATFATTTAPGMRPGGDVWLRYALAPRLQVPVGQADWVIIWGGDPSAVGIHGRRAWRFGEDWLVKL